MRHYSMLTTAVIGALFSSLSYGFFCPKNFNQINMGDSLAQVESQCGPADSKQIKDAPDNEPQEWNYFLPGGGGNGLSMNNSAQGTLKTSFAFDGTGKLINITVNGIGVGSVNGCGSPISLGDSRNAVESACGKSNFITKQSQSSSASSGKKDDMTNKVVELTYASTPPVTLVFEGGKLTSRR